MVKHLCEQQVSQHVTKPCLLNLHQLLSIGLSSREGDFVQIGGNGQSKKKETKIKKKNINPILNPSSKKWMEHKISHYLPN